MQCNLEREMDKCNGLSELYCTAEETVSGLAKRTINQAFCAITCIISKGCFLDSLLIPVLMEKATSSENF